MCERNSLLSQAPSLVGVVGAVVEGQHAPSVLWEKIEGTTLQENIGDMYDMQTSVCVCVRVWMCTSRFDLFSDL